VDALDDAAVDRHVRSVVDEAGRLDVSFNLISRGDVQGTRLLEIHVDDFVAPALAGLRANFITACAAARHMVQHGGGALWGGGEVAQTLSLQVTAHGCRVDCPDRSIS
jgi:hypothetical protein